MLGLGPVWQVIQSPGAGQWRVMKETSPSLPKTPEKRVYRREISFPEAEYSYLLLPYVWFRLPQGKDNFGIGDFHVWQDSPANWKHFLGVPRPDHHLEMYVDWKGRPLDQIWIATLQPNVPVHKPDWEGLVASLFYLCANGTDGQTHSEVRSEDFYFDVIGVPPNVQTSPGQMLRFSKYGVNLIFGRSIHPPLDVTLSGQAVHLPDDNTTGPLNLHQKSKNLFEALDIELKKEDSRLLTSLWFFFQANFRSGTRASYAEDIQNICTAFEALLDIQNPPSTAVKVAQELRELFRKNEQNGMDAFVNRPPSDESELVLNMLKEWVKTLYRVRNSHSHGTKVKEYLFYGRSIWQDSFEIYILACNRILLNRPEQRPLRGTSLSKLLVSEFYLDQFISHLKLGRTLLTKCKVEPKTLETTIRILRAVIEIDPERVTWIASVAQFQNALYCLCTIAFQGVKGAILANPALGSAGNEIVAALDRAYATAAEEKESKNIHFPIDTYLKHAAGAMEGSGKMIPVLGNDYYFYEIKDVFNRIYPLYKKFKSGH